MKGKILAILVLALLCTSASAYRSYDQTCDPSGTAADLCVPGLVCDTSISPNKCNQPSSPLVCTNAPAVYAAPPYVPATSTSYYDASTKITELETGTGIGGATSTFYQAGWFGSWQLSGVIGLAIAIAIIALAAMIGIAFNLPEVKAFANSEISQVIVSAILLLSIIAVIAACDQLANISLQVSSLPVGCNGNEPCHITAARYYLSSIYDVGNDAAENALYRAIVDQKSASSGLQFQTNFWYLLFAGTSMRINAGMSIEAERAGSVFDTASKLMVSIYAQKYFIEVVAFGIAPIFLLLGIVLRTFFFTRKLGGLLLAIAVALFTVYPLAYAFAWYTLNVTIYGERAFGPATDATCPQECSKTYPVAFFVNSSGEIMQFRTTQDLVQAGINDSNWDDGDVNDDGTGEFPGLTACRDLSVAYGMLSADMPANMQDQCSGCPDYCREVPFNPDMPGCDIAACSGCNAGCKIMRQRTDCAIQCSDCDQSCRTQLPVENKCYNNVETNEAPVAANLTVDCGGCDGCPQWCKILVMNYTSGQKQLMYGSEAACNINACKPQSLLYPTGTCREQCLYYSPLTEVNCNGACSGCPEYCRVGNYDELVLAGITTAPFDCNTAACTACPDVCKVNITLPTPSNYPNCAPYPGTAGAADCDHCPEYCRFTSFDTPNFIASGSYLPRDSTTNIPYICSPDTVSWLDCDACDSTCFVDPTAGSSSGFVTSAAANPYLGNGPLQESCQLNPDSGTDGQCGWNPVISNIAAECLVAPHANLDCTAADRQYSDTCTNGQITSTGGSPCCSWTDCDNANCQQYGDSGTCGSTSLASACCAWLPTMQCYGPAGCDLETDQSGCEGSTIGCQWLQRGSIGIPIAYRDEAQYRDTSGCKQCPENCRLRIGSADYEGTCGFPGDPGELVDCSGAASVCPDSLRQSISPSATCGGLSTDLSLPCAECTALCRSTSSDLPGPPSCDASCFDSCPAACKTTPKTGVCSGCMECPLDCLYFPAVRTDCSEVCSDEALAGPVNVGPDDFVKNLPGAIGATDVKNMGTLMVPALVMPLFCIVIVIAFIRVFSPLLGGDIEIPGLGRII